MQTIIPPDRRQRIQDLGYDYAAQPREPRDDVQSLRHECARDDHAAGIDMAIGSGQRL
jgi:hypothetical protein